MTWESYCLHTYIGDNWRWWSRERRLNGYLYKKKFQMIQWQTTSASIIYLEMLGQTCWDLPIKPMLNTICFQLASIWTPSDIFIFMVQFLTSQRLLWNVLTTFFMAPDASVRELVHERKLIWLCISIKWPICRTSQNFPVWLGLPNDPCQNAQ